jgi:ABC-2 type transport system ATP-binding protein
VIIHRGRLVAQEPLETLMARAAGGTVARSPEAERLRALLSEAGLEATVISADELRVAAPPERVGEIAAAAAIVLHELRTEGATLEEVFLGLTSEGPS